MVQPHQRERFLRIARWAGVSLLSLGVLAALSFWLRRLPYESDPAIYSYLAIVGSVLAFTFAANALVRFRGKQGRVALVRAHGFVVERINARLAADAEAPRLSASIGVAVYPLHGDSLEKLLGTADKLLYAVKKRQRRKGGRKTWKEAAA